MSKEDIKKAKAENAERIANIAYSGGGHIGQDDLETAFENGAEWRINSVWHDVTEKPELNEFFVYCDENNQYETDCFHKELILTVNWEDYVAVNKLKRWAYMKDLVPKENI